MKIFSEIKILPDNTPVFVLYLDTEKTGDPNKDCLHSAHDFSDYMDCNDPAKLLEIITPMLSELIYTAYGYPSPNTEPLTDWHATGFDRNYPNGVKA